MKSPTTVLIIDDHQITTAGMKIMLADNTSIEVIGEATNGEDGMLLAQQLTPDIILMDIKMEGKDGLSTTRAILANQPQSRIIGLTAHHTEPLLIQLIQAGARGYLTKSCSMQEITTAIESVMAGERYITPTVTQQLALSPLALRGSNNPFNILSRQEQQVMHYIVVKRQKAQQIAQNLQLSSKTINTYRYRIFDKLGIRNDIELLHLAWHYGIATPPITPTTAEE